VEENKYFTFIISVQLFFQSAVSLGKWENAEQYAKNILEVRAVCITFQVDSGTN
jgi:hypothetical protein